MDKNNIDYNNFGGFSPYPPFMGYEGVDGPCADNSIYNPILQYEQGYMYYRYLSQQLDYKIKCKEYEKICNNKDRRIE